MSIVREGQGMPVHAAAAVSFICSGNRQLLLLVRGVILKIYYEPISNLSSLAILSIENSAAKEIDYDGAISKFADKKVRKISF